MWKNITFLKLSLSQVNFWYLNVVLICIYFITNKVEQFLLYLLATCVSPFAKSVHWLCPFIYWALTAYINNLYKKLYIKYSNTLL